MRFLLDTHVVIWWLTANPNLDDAVRAQILAATEVHVSAASIWEIAIKQAAGRLEGPADLAENARDAGFLQLSMTAGHAIAAGALPPIHRDPFDRMLVAQARCAQLTLVTRDDSIAKYDVQLLKV